MCIYMLYVYKQFFFSFHFITSRYLIFIGSLGPAAVVFFFFSFQALTIRDLRTLLIRISSILKCCKSFRKIRVEKIHRCLYREFGFFFAFYIMLVDFFYPRFGLVPINHHHAFSERLRSSVLGGCTQHRPDPRGSLCFRAHQPSARTRH